MATGSTVNEAQVKRSVTIAGHNTSLSLEPEFWAALQQAARQEGKPAAELVRLIDSQRGGKNLSSAIRVWLLKRASHGVQPATASASSSSSGSASGAKGAAK
jgi:predicted DNA-binding ribbon-helix-helix protein